MLLGGLIFILLFVIFAYVIRERHTLRLHDNRLGRALARAHFWTLTFGNGNSRRQSATWDNSDLGMAFDLSHLGSSIGGMASTAAASGAVAPSSSSTRGRSETAFTLLSSSSDGVEEQVATASPDRVREGARAEEEAVEGIKEEKTAEGIKEEAEEDAEEEQGAVGPRVLLRGLGHVPSHATRDDEALAVTPVEESSL